MGTSQLSIIIIYLLTLIKNEGKEVEISEERVAVGTKFVFAKNENRKVCGVIIYKGKGNGTVHVGNLAEKTGPATDGHIIAREVGEVCFAVESSIRFIYPKLDTEAATS
jgi:hypothetical protein